MTTIITSAPTTSSATMIPSRSSQSTHTTTTAAVYLSIVPPSYPTDFPSDPNARPAESQDKSLATIVIIVCSIGLVGFGIGCLRLRRMQRLGVQKHHRGAKSDPNADHELSQVVIFDGSCPLPLHAQIVKLSLPTTDAPGKAGSVAHSIIVLPPTPEMDNIPSPAISLPPAYDEPCSSIGTVALNPKYLI